MTGRKRIVGAMDLQVPDRVPLMCQLSIGHYFVQLDVEPAQYWINNDIIADGFIRLADEYHFDGILINLPGRAPDAADHIDRIEDTPDAQIIYYDNGETCTCPWNDLPVHDDVPAPSIHELDPETVYYEDPHTLGGLKYPFHYDLEPTDEYFPEYLFDIIYRVLDEVGDRLSVHSEVFSPFTQLMERLGYENGLMALMEHSQKCKDILDRFARGAADLASRQAKTGVDAVLISSAFAGGGFISRDMYEEFVGPYEEVVVNAIKKAGARAYTHTCGNIGDRLELMWATGIDGIDTMDPPPLGDTKLVAAKKRVGGNIFLKGNIDPVNVLLEGSVQQVRENAIEKINAAAENGGYILSSACSVAPEVPPENLHVLYEVVEEHGYY